MKIRIYSSGYEHLGDYVIPFVMSVQEHEPGAFLTIVDNGSPDPYPLSINSAAMIRTENLAILTSFNVAIKDHFDWLVITDTDVLCLGKFLEKIEQFEMSSIYGQQMYEEGALQWFDSWLMCIPWQIWETVGRFDEDFKLTGAFQDLDYCIRARQAGYGLRMAELPFEHLEANTTHGSPYFWENREYNRGLIETKHGIRVLR